MNNIPFLFIPVKMCLHVFITCLCVLHVYKKCEVMRKWTGIADACLIE